MRNLRNTVSLIGRIGQNPEITKFESGTSKAVISLATSDYYKNKAGEKIESTEWHRLVAWGPQVKIVEQYLKKGMEICIEGKLTYNKWEDKDGNKKSITEINVNDFLMLGKKEA